MVRLLKTWSVMSRGDVGVVEDVRDTKEGVCSAQTL